MALANVYKQLNAPLGSLGRNSLAFANQSITSDDATYANYLATIGAITSSRDELAGQNKLLLDGAAFGDQPINENQQRALGGQAQQLIDQVATGL